MLNIHLPEQRNSSTIFSKYEPLIIRSHNPFKWREMGAGIQFELSSLPKYLFNCHHRHSLKQDQGTRLHMSCQRLSHHPEPHSRGRSGYNERVNQNMVD